jgi:hypothetical protein
VRRTVGVVVLLCCALLVSGCTTTVRGIASPGPVAAPAGSIPVEPALPGGAAPTCLVDGGCDDEESTTTGAVSCSTLPAAVHSFDAAASAAFPGWQDRSGTPGQLRALQDVVAGVVESCGYQVMIDVADQFADPASYDLLVDANLALGYLLLEPEGLRCADLQSLGYSAKDAVDYWFLWEAPDLMDADLNGVPCETVFADVERYLPAYY